MLCVHCGFANPKGMNFCGRCGTQLPRPCPACGFTNPTEHVFCGKCGTRLSVQPFSPGATPDEPPFTLQAQHTAQNAPPPEIRHTPAAERRQLTVLFCELVDSTALAGRLDPEDYREVVRAYQDTCAAIIQRFEGHIAQYLGDGILVYFGYPQAHEDDAQRAVRTGLGMVEATATLNRRMGSLAQRERAGGEGPQTSGKAPHPNPLPLSEGKEWVSHNQRDNAPGVHLAVRGLTPLVGREHEVGLLRDRWAQVEAGRGHIVVLSGEAGIGKSRLVQVVKDESIDAVTLRIEYHCSPYHQHSALYPVIAHLERALALRQDDTPEDKLRKLGEALRPSPLPLAEAVPLFAALLSVPLPVSYPPLTLTPQRQKQKTLEALLTWLLALTEQQPLLFVVEDLHWIDPSTLEFLTLLVEQGPTARLLTLLTCRRRGRYSTYSCERVAILSAQMDPVCYK